MNINDLLSDAKARADVNGDGKLSLQDIESLRDKFGIDTKHFDTLRSKLDASGDGKLDINDLAGGLGSIGGTINDLKEKFFGGASSHGK